MGNYVLALRRKAFKVTVPEVREGLLRHPLDIEFHAYEYLFKPPDSSSDKLISRIEASWAGVQLPKYVVGGDPKQEGHELKFAVELMERKVGLTYNDGSDFKIGPVIGFVKWNPGSKIEFMTCRDGLINNIEKSIPSLCADMMPENKHHVTMDRAKIEFLKSLPNEPGFQDGDRLMQRLNDFGIGYHKGRSDFWEEIKAKTPA